MKHLPNALSVLRGFLALAFLNASPYVRASAIVGAVITDVLDGFLARKFGATSKLGTLLDPLADKIFVGAALITLLSESSYSWNEALPMLSRDLALAVFSIYLLFRGKWAQYRIRAFIMGKLCTSMQFCALLFTILQKTLPGSFYSFLLFFGCMGFFELLWREKNIG